MPFNVNTVTEEMLKYCKDLSQATVGNQTNVDNSELETAISIFDEAA